MFQDPLGERRHIADASGADTLELLCLRPDLTSVPSFEFALRERVSRLANFRHAYYGRVRNVDRLNDGTTLALVSERVPGVRLSEILDVAEERELTLDINTALTLIRQLVPAVALLHEHARDVANGALGPERLIITPNARLVIVEHVLGAALEQLRFSQERYWNELRIPVPRATGLPRFDHRADVMQLGMVALSLVLGRSVQPNEFPSQLSEVVASAWAISARGGLEPLPSGLRAWLTRALQLDPRNSFPSAIEARAELDRMLGDSDYIVAPHALDTFLAQYQDIRLQAGPLETFKQEQPKAEAVRDLPTPEPPASVPDAEPVFQPLAASVLLPAFSVEPLTASAKASVKEDEPKVEAAWLSSPYLEPLAGSLKRDAPKLEAARVIAPIERPIITEAPTWQTAVDQPAETVPVVQSSPVDDAEDADEMAGHPGTRRWPIWAALAGVVIVLVAGGVFAGRNFFVGTANAPATGTLAVVTDPPGAQVTVDGVLQGVTPMSLALRPGSHTVELQAGNELRSIPVTIAAGTQASQYVELSKAGQATGQLQVREPIGAQVTVDGVARGKAPLTIGDLSPGTHAVVLDHESGSVKQDVTIDAGATASLVVPLPATPSVPVSGWVAVTAPVTMQIFENGRLLGNSETDRIMMAAGRHDIEVSNQPLAYRAVYTVQVVAGRVVPVKIELPQQKVALNAVPWAEVWIDGEKIGETPLGDVSVVVGPHEIVFRHPQLGEQRHAITVTAAAPARLSVDMRKP